MFHTVSHRKVFALTVSCLLVAALSAEAKEKAADPWVEQIVVKISPKMEADGDSFGMILKTAKGNETTRNYWLYGTDCPESDAEDKRLKSKIKQQAEYFGRTPAEIPPLGKQAAEFTRQLLSEGKPRIWTRGKVGKEVPRSDDRPHCYYAIIEVTAADGKRHLLHELLLEAGLARVYGEPAAWPPKQEDRHGETATREKFMKDLQAIEKDAKKAGRGLWKKPDAAPGRLR